MKSGIKIEKNNPSYFPINFFYTVNVKAKADKRERKILIAIDIVLNFRFPQFVIRHFAVSFDFPVLLSSYIKRPNNL